MNGICSRKLSCKPNVLCLESGEDFDGVALESEWAPEHASVLEPKIKHERSEMEAVRSTDKREEFVIYAQESGQVISGFGAQGHEDTSASVTSSDEHARITEELVSTFDMGKEELATVVFSGALTDNQK